MDGKGWIQPSFHPLALGPPSNFRATGGRQKTPPHSPAGRAALPQSQKTPEMPAARDESHAFGHHTLAHNASRHLILHRTTRPSTSSGNARPLSTAGNLPEQSRRIMSSASSPALQHPWATTWAATSSSSSVALAPDVLRRPLSPPRTASRARRDAALDPASDATIGPNLAYANYMALGTPMMQRLVRKPRKPTNASPARQPYPSTRDSARASNRHTPLPPSPVSWAPHAHPSFGCSPWQSGRLARTRRGCSTT